MSKVTAKLQVTLPKALAEKYGIVPGSEIVWEAAGDAIRVLRLSGARRLDVAAKLALFDAGTARHDRRHPKRVKGKRPPVKRGWTREDLYERRASG
jgi:bifunctional DNA-binding transcriptional regulator/antitoxin component of YhaV-PrlF toxin-antitoxin module